MSQYLAAKVVTETLKQVTVAKVSYNTLKFSATQKSGAKLV